MKGILLSVFVVMLLVFAGCRDSRPHRAISPLEYTFEGWLADKKIVQLGEVFYGETPSDTIYVCNPTEKRRSCRFAYDMSYLQVQVQPEWLNPGDTGMVVVKYRTKDLGRYGDVVTTIRWMKDDGMPGMPMAVMAHVTEDFREWGKEERRNAPQVFVAEREHDFGQLKEGEKAEWKARIENHGKKDLIIRNITTPCGCTVVVPEKKVIAAGEGCVVDVTFNTAGRHGQQHKTIVLMCNDWREPEVLIKIKALIEDNE